MNLTWTPQERRFREEVRAFAEAELPGDIRDKVLRHQRLERDDYVRWHNILAERGWGAPNWPVEHGGTGWNALQRLIFEVECFKAGAPRLLPFGLSMIGPVLMKYGSAEQQARFLPRIPRVEDWWCQGYSEPGSGSDLASLKTRAERDGDDYVVNGQKTWTTLAQYADWMFCLARTDSAARAQRGISMLLLDMRAPGVTVRPIRTLDGGHDVNEVWLENVRVPAANLVGEENQGWTYAKYLLGHERTGIAGLGHCHRELGILKSMAGNARSRGRPLLSDSRMRDRISRIEVDIMALEMLLLRVASSNDGSPGPEASVLKIRGSEIQQDLAMLQMEVAGPDAWPYDPDWMFADAAWHGPGPEMAAAAGAGYADMRKTSIYGGTTEVQKGIIARQVLGL
ncbi:acyl-CoA dehydrogenase family protein [Achromobacter denitrificans]|jgi:alkylation response protein AidB-like acyl-CoA dehydrogenase|uniref:Acyl-CoA dehydrogenase family protein n=1 Tax=Achromobacter denitrificans TaxID=32002 RepID=A0ABZ3G5V1_ACHDE|nr:acyl-CoA dehydrogenase family protein [Achromobacter denitrificans]MDF3852028.1 acyl-CoA dehydrogenase family protein [Achromobacter denitrificans]MDF3858679.1 acyl-CoA dehydrogenase family protein [Achromobacter denitrificans]RSE89577.1 pimeloyl-CoA dehydrogenase large subunit [Achromobacter denitrificans]CAB3811167.1 Acyl-CoA dehydrogenase FadE26 [Achromobacter denitrificans]GFN24427.1 acyl-CoA dehydrogenase [Achromobacter denitrificans]